MEGEVVKKIAPKLGISVPNTIKKALELMRMCDARCTNLSSLGVQGSCKAVLCLELAASCQDQPVNKDIAVRLSGVSKKVYSNALQTLGRMLDVQPRASVKDLCVQFGCVGAADLAKDILHSYQDELQTKVSDADISQPMFPAAAVYASAKQLKIKVDKAKLTSIAATRKTVFDKLCIEMTKHAEKIAEAKKTPGTKSKRTKTFIEELEESFEDGRDSSSTKVARLCDSDDEEEDYEEWKRKILENAARALGEKD
ncbi:origin recognition complex subunit 6-like [Branchiostoma floridae x Branchiostoma japonicum]